MTRKDYIKIAEALASANRAFEPNGSCQTAVAVATDRLADMLEADNPRFDRAAFYAAVGIEDVSLDAQEAAVCARDGNVW